MIDAKEARRRTQEILNERYKAHEDELNYKIEQAISKGVFEIEHDRIEPPLKKILEQKGYKVEIVNRQNQVGGDVYYKISF